ncbi:MAG: hypothetical protein QW594_00415 [Candidatus Woesearchaeota archaeon]
MENNNPFFFEQGHKKIHLSFNDLFPESEEYYTPLTRIYFEGEEETSRLGLVSTPLPAQLYEKQYLDEIVLKTNKHRDKDQAIVAMNLIDPATPLVIWYTPRMEKRALEVKVVKIKTHHVQESNTEKQHLSGIEKKLRITIEEPTLHYTSLFSLLANNNLEAFDAGYDFTFQCLQTTGIPDNHAFMLTYGINKDNEGKQQAKLLSAQIGARINETFIPPFFKYYDFHKQQEQLLVLEENKAMVGKNQIIDELLGPYKSKELLSISLPPPFVIKAEEPKKHFGCYLYPQKEAEVLNTASQLFAQNQLKEGYRLLAKYGKNPNYKVVHNGMIAPFIMFVYMHANREVKEEDENNKEGIISLIESYPISRQIPPLLEEGYNHKNPAVEQWLFNELVKEEPEYALTCTAMHEMRQNMLANYDALAQVIRAYYQSVPALKKTNTVPEFVDFLKQAMTPFQEQGKLALYTGMMMLKTGLANEIATAQNPHEELLKRF